MYLILTDWISGVITSETPESGETRFSPIAGVGQRRRRRRRQDGEHEKPWDSH